MQFYIQRKEQFAAQLSQLKQSYNLISLLRAAAAVFVIGSVYFAISSVTARDTAVLCILLGCGAFIVLLRYHNTLSLKKKKAEALLKVNEDEVNFLEYNKLPFESGSEFADTSHPYAHDLDIFGNHSLYQHLNRAATYKGRRKLADMLLNLLPNNEILKNQAAIKELGNLIEFRQEILAQGRINNDSKPVYQKITAWVAKPAPVITTIARILGTAAPILLVGLLLYYWIAGDDSIVPFINYLLAFNVAFALKYVKLIANEVKDTTEVAEIIKGYAAILEIIEKQQFESEKLNDLKARIKDDNQQASKQLARLGTLFSQLDSASNILAAIVMNGLCLYHFHILDALGRWKKKNTANIDQWLDVIAEFEALGSFANMHYNNPDYAFPEINTQYKVAFTNTAHPLLNGSKRVSNTIDFSPAFTILTGSNMSGKSTFLRALGVNMVLAGTGAPVCATAASIHPLPVLVSMRLSDSLSDNTSYFYAEIKRLKEITDSLRSQRAFVLLDEILRGTNSDDKRAGTVKVIENLVHCQAVGAIATHDIEVCDTALQYPDALINRCFEAQIIDNDIYFDYTLRNGICKNRSATFLMQKLGVI
ncbi:DNA mismatch repair protein [Flavobacterium akiainvivens]|uniref:DNA mismatch repair protein n=1 Tax=Flavobacterium akiainvivens TaxID=1202724 RepID=A0A0M8M8K4_9FLAO|nr:DNA mismatch repair protein [Flavobacterium akiainvivens]KOS04775.1 DNA mismatch repair protein [Flavobacterium akiainvivens]SFQ66403.1 MutS domain V [Flavobacterium akiainvivens]